MKSKVFGYEAEKPSHAPRILLRSSWQTVNIGDISHTPGILGLLRRHVPEAKVMLWPDHLDRGVRALLQREFPDLRIIEDVCWDEDRRMSGELAEAFAAADFLLHSSGPGVVGARQIEDWVRHTGKPYGIYGVTIDPLGVCPGDRDRPTEGASLAEQSRQIAALPADHLDARERRLLDGAGFVFCRDSLSLDYLRGQGVACPVLEFAPDAAFGMELRDDQRAAAFLSEYNLAPGEFACVIPRLRYTPYHLTHNVPATRRDILRMELSERYREADMARLREAITRWVRSTGLKVLLCPEMTYQIDVAKTSVFDRLPDDVKRHTVWRSTYWLPGEARSVFACSRLLVSMDNHSPIFALSLGLPTIFLRHATDTIKGQMWPDLGLGDWFMETDETDGATLFDRMLAIHADYPKAVSRAKALMARVEVYQESSMAVLRHLLSPAGIIRSVHAVGGSRVRLVPPVQSIQRV